MNKFNNMKTNKFSTKLRTFFSLVKYRIHLSVLAGTLLFTALISFPGISHAEDSWTDGRQAYFVKDYRYDPAETSENSDTGLALCATRCNALSIDYADYIKPGGWALVKVASDRELTVSLNNPFIKGNCICTVDEFLIKVDNRNRANPPKNKKQ